MEKKDYCIGLDIGTNSTGYAMTDVNGQLLKHQKRSTFGVVLFDEAQTAEKRRMFRSSRRRNDRREKRIGFLQSLMEKDVLTIDPHFYLRLNESFLQNDERAFPHLYGTLPKSIWVDGTPSDFPTIYHLRNALIQVDKQADIRYVYMALHHIIKYRGHFLLEGETLEQTSNSAEEMIADILDQLTAEPYNWSFTCSKESVSLIYSILRQKNISNSKRIEAIVSFLSPDRNSKNAAKALASFFVGNKASLKVLLNYHEDSPDEKLQLSGEWDEEEYINALGNAADLFEEIVGVYRWQVFSNLRADGETISQTMIRRFEKHQADLRTLKTWVRQFAPEEYKHFFKTVREGVKNYPAYSGHYKKKDAKSQKIGTVTQQDFYASIKSLLQKNKSNEAIEASKPILQAMSEENGFLPLLRIYLNGAIPNQMHAEELSMIIDRQGKYYPNLLANKDKILSICTFRLPYFVGPLNTSSPFQKWLVRAEGTPARPWNFYEVVDKAKTANGFIENLTNKCTYLPTEDVLPLHSLLYEEYLLLDELNRVRINGDLIPFDLKQKIIKGLFTRQKTISENTFINWLKTNTPYAVMDKIEISGLHGDGKFNATLRTYIDFTTKVGIEVNNNTIPMIETLVRWSTIFENRGILREKIQETYPTLTPKQINYICQRRYSGWGRLSKKLLDGICGANQAEGKTIIDMMRTTNDNFMKVINNKNYGFDEAINACQPVIPSGPIKFDEVQALQGSPALKRGIWQAVQIVEELIHHQGKLPKAIYVENTRNEIERLRGRRIPDRIQTIETLYHEAAYEIPENCTANLTKCKNEKQHLTDRQYLYFLQLGKCLYSGKPLDFNQLELYDIDHILPRSYIKDDSLDNLALVYQSENRRKLDSMLLDESVRKNSGAWWVFLRQSKLISDKKYYNLTRSHVDEKDVLGFINRQLIETSQIVKHVITLFKSHYPDVNVHAVNARLSSSVRETFGLHKIRELNNTHHAFDAFLACTIGCFTDKYLWWIGDDSVAGATARAAWSKNSTNGIILGMFETNQIDKSTGEILWNAQDHITYIKKVWRYKDHFVVSRKYESSGEFFNQTKYPAGSIEAKFPLKKNLPTEKYGGYNNINPAYIAAISYKKGKKRVGALINVPIYIAKQAKHDPEALYNFLHPNYDDVRILKAKILLNQKVIYEASDLYLRSCSEAHNAKELYLPEWAMQIIYECISFPSHKWDFSESELDKLIELLLDKLNQQYGIFKGVCNRLYTAKDKIMTLSISDKAVFVIEMLKIMHTTGEYAMFKKRLESLGISDNQGRITNKPFNVEKLILVDQSVTGFYERRTSLWDSEQS